MSIDFTGMGNAGLNWDNILNAINSQESATKIEGVKVFVSPAEVPAEV